MTTSVYEAVGGRPAVLALAGAWHARCLQDDVAAHPFSHGGVHPQHVERLAAYWVESLGGPADYTGALGDHSSVVRMHAGNGVHRELDDRVVQCFEAAVDDVGLGRDEALRSVLVDWFRWAVDDMAEHPGPAADVPDGLPMPHWSTAGLVSGPGDGPLRDQDQLAEGH